MEIDPSKFIVSNVVDSCALWNLLAADLLYQRARQANCSFCCTRFVDYECAHKQRTQPTDGDRILQKKFAEEKAADRIGVYNLDVADLQDVDVLLKRKRVSKGELSTIVFARKTRQAVLTDDQGARKLSEQIIGREQTQTTPHLVGWLAFHGRLSEVDLRVTAESQLRHGRQIHPHTENGFALGVKFRQMATTAL